MEACNTIEPVGMAGFVPAVLRFKMDGWRVVQICAARLPDGYELSYSFGKGYDMRTLRLTVGEDERVPSITQIYPGAFLQENEAAELFGVPIEGMVQDYHDSSTASRRRRRSSIRGERAMAKQSIVPFGPQHPVLPERCIWTWSWRTRWWSRRCPASALSTAGWKNWSRPRTTRNTSISPSGCAASAASGMGWATASAWKRS